MAAGVTTTAITTPEGRFTADEQIPALSAVGYRAVAEHCRPVSVEDFYLITIVTARLNVKTRQGVPTGPAGIHRGVAASGRGPTGAAGPRRSRRERAGVDLEIAIGRMPEIRRQEELHFILRLALTSSRTQ